MEWTQDRQTGRDCGMDYIHIALNCSIILKALVAILMGIKCNSSQNGSSELEQGRRGCIKIAWVNDAAYCVACINSSELYDYAT